MFFQDRLAIQKKPILNQNELLGLIKTHDDFLQKQLKMESSDYLTKSKDSPSVPLQFYREKAIRFFGYSSFKKNSQKTQYLQYVLQENQNQASETQATSELPQKPRAESLPTQGNQDKAIMTYAQVAKIKQFKKSFRKPKVFRTTP
jgi:hypothetical protein